MHALIVASLLAIGGAAQADTLSKIKDSGVLSMGVRESSGALSYALGDGKYAGFHVELCEWVAAAVRLRLGLPRVDIEYQPVTPHNRIALVRSGTVDLECGATANTTARQRDVSFALTTYVEEARIGSKVVSLEPIAPSKTRVGLAAGEATRTAWAYPNDRPLEAYGHP